MKKILILTPLKIEFDELVSFFKINNFEFEDLKTENSFLESKIPLLYCSRLNLYLAIGGHGKIQFAIHTQYLISKIDNLDLVISVGSAGGLDANLSPGTVILANQIIEHDFKQKIYKPKKDFPIFETNEFYRDQLLKNLTSKKLDFEIIVKSIASGDEDIVTSERSLELASTTGAAAVTWESAGFARACKFSKVAFLELRAITDNCNLDSKKDFLSNLKLSFKNLYEVINLLIHQIDPEN